MSEFKSLLQTVPTLTGGEFDAWVEARFERASKRRLLSTLRPLAEMEAAERKSENDPLSRIQSERFSRIKKILSRLLGPDVFQPKYDRLLTWIIEENERIKCRTKRLADEPIPFVKIRQEAVGHGGFHHGILATHHYHTRWVYDCGSWHKLGRQSLEKCIEDFASECARDHRLGGGHLELLFISHFDADHVSGLRRLLEAVPGKTGTVVLPYLGSMGVFAVLCAAAARGRCPQDLIDQVVDPVGWCQRFGVLRVIQIRPGTPPTSGGEEPRIPDLPLPGHVTPPESADGVFRPVILGPDRKPVKTRRQRRNGGVCETAIAPAGTVIAGATPPKDAWIDWWFVPYAHPISSQTRKKLNREAKRAVGISIGSRNLKDRLVHLLSLKSGLKKLKRAYHRAGLKDANRSSLSLYAGPQPSRENQRSILAESSDRTDKPAGWLLTGDAILKEGSGYPNWITFFKPLKDSVGTLMLPHHGSRHNFCDAILKDVRLADVFITADEKDKTRPNKAVKDAAREEKRRIRKVSEARRNGITEISGPRRLTPKDFPYTDEW